MLKTKPTKYRLRVSTDKGDNTESIGGRFGNIYEYDSERLAMMYLSDSVGKANNRRRECEESGMEIVQDGDTEFAAASDPGDPKQAKLAIRVAGVKTKRVPSDAQLAVLAKMNAHRIVPNVPAEGQKRL